MDVDPEVLVGILWAHATSEDGLQHVRARAGPGRVDVAFFLTASTPTDAFGAARRLCQRAISASALLSGTEIRTFSGRDQEYEC
ncbi:hypothetical protein [Dactylosporangium cerinum]